MRGVRSRGIFYLDSSAIVKVVVEEPESAALLRFLRGRRAHVSCALARTEVMRAVRHLGPAATARARDVLQRLDLVRLDDSLLDAAGALDADVLRSLDAIHLAAAIGFGEQLEGVVTYDARMTKAARLLGLPIAAPA
ncbi:MAG: type II toxin-antitoxin system VapC family toxin [Candidatus Binatia bacterium]